jgi:hypothetical protein
LKPSKPPTKGEKEIVGVENGKEEATGWVGVVRERSELTCGTQRHVSETTQNSPRIPCCGRPILLLEVETQIATIDKSCGMDFFHW